MDTPTEMQCPVAFATSPAPPEDPQGRHNCTSTLTWPAEMHVARCALQIPATQTEEKTISRANLLQGRLVVRANYFRGAGKKFALCWKSSMDSTVGRLHSAKHRICRWALAQVRRPLCFCNGQFGHSDRRLGARRPINRRLLAGRLYWPSNFALQ